MQVGGRRLVWWGRAYSGLSLTPPSWMPGVVASSSGGLCVSVQPSDGGQICGSGSNPSEDGWGLCGEEGGKEAEGRAVRLGRQVTGICLWASRPFPSVCSQGSFCLIPCTWNESIAPTWPPRTPAPQGLCTTSSYTWVLLLALLGELLPLLLGLSSNTTSGE